MIYTVVRSRLSVMVQVACIYISVLFVFARFSSTENTYLTSSSEAESLGLVDKCLAIFAQ